MDHFLITIPAAMGLGVLHSLEPGHGKGVMSAYLVSSRSSIRDAILIGFVSALSHTFSILILAFVANTTIRYLPSHLEHWIELVSGCVISLMGISILWKQMFPKVVTIGRIGHHAHVTACSHGHVHGHDHLEETVVLHGEDASFFIRKRRLLALGAFTGLIPCPSALAILLASFTVQQIYAGIVLVLVFSLGSAMTMSTLGILILKASRSLDYLEKSRFSQSMTKLSAMLITCLGALVLYRALIHFSMVP
ncbi:nickel/cobalt efflux system [Collibacillus ludicampi]|uniref:Nickel/cobalt efflux system n=1 Tax=Collibacillus ludicampi TaxID=2771369 RepID=A0AAV4LK77_9BACL|nr:sulfite exporter TauE/SafE family protein [Collibacillus ludicampi]GIM48242.1 nickel/cobalt efflux system [Collibacillus ludicampi]